MLLTRRRLIVLIPVLLLLVAAGWTAWQAWHVQADLSAAQRSVTALQDALDEGDDAAADSAVTDLNLASTGAAGRTDGAWWEMLTYVPFVGDDAEGVRGLSSSLDQVATGGVQPLRDTVDLLDTASTGGRIDVGAVRDLAAPVDRGHRAFERAAADVVDLDSSGYVGALRSRFDDYVDTVTGFESALGSAGTATAVLPMMLGGDGPRDYLLVFQNNAEIRAGGGGLPGAYAIIHAEDGKLAMTQQGGPRDFGGELEEPILPLSEAELEVYDTQLGTYFQDANFTPDFPRAAELMAARWQQTFDRELDGVVSLDTVAMSYLLEGTGPVTVDGVTYTADNAVKELLNTTYVELDPAEQDARFEKVAAAVFTAVTGDLASPLGLAKGLGRAADEGRFLVNAFDPSVQEQIAGTRVAGELAGDDGSTPHVDIGLNDATAAKMSYYLRYDASVRSEGCRAGVQSLAGSMTVAQAISADDAAQLPDSVTGTGWAGTDRGAQLVLIRLYGPAGGSFERIQMDGERIESQAVELDGRPVETLVAFLSTTDDLKITWGMKTGDGQTGDVELGVTPGVVPGGESKVAASSC